jgi:hypothetical protein
MYQPKFVFSQLMVTQPTACRAAVAPIAEEGGIHRVLACATTDHYAFASRPTRAAPQSAGGGAPPRTKQRDFTSDFRSRGVQQAQRFLIRRGGDLLESRFRRDFFFYDFFERNFSRMVIETNTELSASDIVCGGYKETL